MAADHVVAVDAAALGAPTKPRMRSYAGAIVLLALTMVSAAALRGVFSPMQEAAKHSLALTDFQMSLVQGIAASIPIAILAMPIGWLVDRTRRMTLLILMSLIWTAGSIWTAYAHDFNSLFLARMLAGLGSITSLVVSISLLADMTTPEKRGRAMILLSVGVNVGAALAFAVGGTLLGILPKLAPGGLFGFEPWRAVSLIFGAGGALIALTLVPLREPARHEIETNTLAIGPVLNALWARRGFLAPLFIGQVSVVMADAAAAIWAAPVLIRFYHQQPEQFGPWVGGIVLFGGILGAVLGGLVADFGQKIPMRGGIMLGAIVLSIISIPAALFPIMPTVTGFGVLLGVLLLAGAAAGLVTATALAVLIPNEVRGVCLGAFIVVASIVGFGVAPTLVTLASDAMGGEGHLAQSLAITGVIVDAISAVGFILAMLNLRKITAPA